MNKFYNAVVVLFFLAGICFSQESQKIFLSISKEFKSKTGISILYIGEENRYCSTFIKTLSRDLNYSGYFTVQGLFSNKTTDVSLIKDLTEKSEFVCIVRLLNQQMIEVKLVDSDNSERLKKVYPISTLPADNAHSACDDIVYYLTGRQPIAKTKIAYVSGGSGSSQIFIVDYDGENKIQITDSPCIKDFPKFLSDDKLTYISYKTGYPSVVLFDLANKQEMPIFSFPGINAFVDFSKVNSEMVVVLSKDGNPEIYLAALDGNILRRLTYSSGIDTSPCFSPDGRYIVFSSDRSGRPQIYIMDRNGAGIRRISYGYDYAVAPVWSPDGKYICYLIRTQGIFQMVIYDTGSKKSSLLPVKIGWSESVSWAPDSRHIVFTRRQNYKCSIWIVDVFTGELRQLTGDKENCYSPAWSQ